MEHVPAAPADLVVARPQAQPDVSGVLGHGDGGHVVRLDEQVDPFQLRSRPGEPREGHQGGGGVAGIPVRRRDRVPRRGRPRDSATQPQSSAADRQVVGAARDGEGEAGLVFQPLMLSGEKARPASSLYSAGMLPISGRYGSVASSATNPQIGLPVRPEPDRAAAGSGSGQVSGLTADVRAVASGRGYPRSFPSSAATGPPYGSPEPLLAWYLAQHRLRAGYAGCHDVRLAPCRLVTVHKGVQHPRRLRPEALGRFCHGTRPPAGCSANRCSWSTSQAGPLKASA